MVSRVRDAPPSRRHPPHAGLAFLARVQRRGRMLSHSPSSLSCRHAVTLPRCHFEQMTYAVTVDVDTAEPLSKVTIQPVAGFPVA